MPELNFGGHSMTMELPRSWPVPLFDYGDRVRVGHVEPRGKGRVIGMSYAKTASLSGTDRRWCYDVEKENGDVYQSWENDLEPEENDA